MGTRQVQRDHADDNQADANHLHHRYRRAEKQYGDQHNGGRTDCRPQRIGDVRLHAVRIDKASSAKAMP